MSSTIYRHFSSMPCVKSRRLQSRIFAFILSKVHFSLLGFKSAGVAPLPPRFRTFLDETVKAIAFFPRVKHLLGCDDKCMLSVPLSMSDLHYSRWQSGEICQVLSTGAFTLFSHVVHASQKIFSPSLSLLCLCLAHAFVSLTRWRLAIVQKAVRFFFLRLLDWSLHMVTCVWWFLTAYEEGLFTRC